MTQSLEFETGKPAVISCPYGETKDSNTLIWKHNSTMLPQSLQDKNGTVTFSSIQSTDSGIYTCLILNVQHQQKANCLTAAVTVSVSNILSAGETSRIY